MSIPNRFHFVWYGRELPFTHALALRSVVRSCADAEVILHASDDLTGQPHWDALVRDCPSVRREPIDPQALLRACARYDLPTAALQDTYDELLRRRGFAALSDLLRYALLLAHGGVYLDLDVLVVRDLAPLRKVDGFCGRERILVDAAVFRRGGVLRYLRTSPLDLMRTVCSRVDRGVGWWRRIETAFPAAINGAVLGLSAGHELARQALAAVPARAPELARRRPAIGPDLLQDLLATPRTDVLVLPPPAFYPLGPTMARHYFRSTTNVDELAAQVVSPETYVIHWYNDNLRSMSRPPDPESIRTLTNTQLFSRLAAPFLPQSHRAAA